MATRNMLWHLSSVYNDMRRDPLIESDELAYARAEITANQEIAETRMVNNLFILNSIIMTNRGGWVSNAPIHYIRWLFVAKRGKYQWPGRAVKSLEIEPNRTRAPSFIYYPQNLTFTTAENGLWVSS